MFDDDKIAFIETLPDADTILIIWIKLLTLAGKCNAGGFIMLTEKIPYTAETLANKFGRPLNTVKLALQTFKELDMIEQDPENKNAFYLLNWTKHQNIETMDKIREQARERKQRERERKKLSAPETNAEEVNNIVSQYTKYSDNVTSRDSHVTDNVTCHVTSRIENKNRDIENKDLNTLVKNDESENEFSDVNDSFDNESISNQELPMPDIDNNTHIPQKCDPVPYKEIMHEFNTRCTKLSNIRGIDGSRQKRLKACWKANPNLDFFINLFEEVNKSDFLTGNGGTSFIAGFDWIIKPANLQKILEGNYKNRPKSIKTLPNGRLPNYANFDEREYTEEEIAPFIITAGNKRR
jgi:predicted phage replisome organizer